MLSDEQKRSWYDEFGEASLHTGFDPEQARRWRSFKGFGGRAGPSVHHNPFSGGGFESINLDDLLGSMFSNAGRGPRRGRGPRPGPDVEAQTQVDLLSAVKGSEVLLVMKRPESCKACGGSGGSGRQTCPTCKGTGRRSVNRLAILCETCAGSGSTFTKECPRCAGSGRVMEERHLKVRIPPGVSDGQTIRLRGQGGEGQHGGPPGNLLLTVNVSPHPLLRRNGDDLEMDLPITISEAVSGATVQVPTPDGRVKVKIPAGAANGQRMRLRNKGVPRRDGSRGHMYLVLRPATPTAIDDDTRRLARELDRFYAENPRANLTL